MAKFQVSDSSKHENPSYDIDGEHKVFHKAIMELQQTLSERPAPSVVTRMQVDSVIAGFEDVMQHFFRCRPVEHAAARLCGTVLALNEGIVYKPEPSKDSFKELWHEQRKLAEHLLHSILRTGRNLSDGSPAVKELVGSMPGRLHLGTVSKGALKEDLQTLWDDVLRRIVGELWRYQ
jgi:hypothetical protein